MNGGEKKLLLASLNGTLRAIERIPPAQKKEHLSLESAMDFNQHLKTIRETFPQLAQALPRDLDTRSLYSEGHMSAAKYFDLEIAVEQALALLDTVDG